MSVFLRKVCTAFRIVQMSWYTFLLKKRLKSCGEHTGFNGKMNVINPGNLSIGSNCSFNHNDYINAHNPINIGDDVTISANVTLLSTGIDYQNWFKNGKKAHTLNTKSDGLNIGNHVWIGAGATILPGAHLSGEYIVIAAGAVVTHEITESYCVVGGIPAKIIKKFDTSQLAD